MKNHLVLPAVLGLTLGSLHAQTVPLFINYQGRITSGTGIPLGATGAAPGFTAAPVNRKVIFRIFDAQTGGVRLWSEQQTVTISLGEFSVLLGQGTDAVYNAVTESRPAIDTAFAGSNRFLEIVVDDGDGTFTTAADVPINPRQRITSTAYSLRAKVADTVTAGSINAAALAAGAVTADKIIDNAINNVKIANLSILNEDLANNLITTDKIADLSVTTADLANGSVTAAKLDANIGLWSLTGANVYRPAGSVGIGKVPAVALDVVGAISATGNITSAGNLTTGGTFSAASISTGAFSAATINTTGAAGNILANGAIRARGGPPAGNNGFSFTGNGGDNDSGMFSSADGQLEFYSNNVERMRISTAGNLGIGTTAPAVPLDVRIQNNLTMTDNGYQSNQGTVSGSGAGATWTSTGTYSTNYASIELYGMSGGGELGGYRNAVAPVGIRSEGWIASAKGIMVYSDQRIKQDFHASATGQDLADIRKLQVTDYRMVDPAGDGLAWRKGFIAQEVEKVIPGAVTRSLEFVPDIFSVATAVEWHAGANQLAITLGKDHDLKVGDCVRLHLDGSRLDLNVSAVTSARGFIVENCNRAPEKVLVYGRQVSDFRTVDYDRIFTTAVGALQELKREKDTEVKALQEENASLRDRLAALEAADKARDAKLAVIETLLLAKDQAAARAVMFKAAE